MSKNILVCGGGGFIGSHLVKKLKADGNFVRVVDLKKPEFADSHADDFIVGDLRDREICKNGLKNIDIVYQLAADMGGAGFVFSGENDADIMHNSALINLNVIETAYGSNVERIFYSSSACMYPEYNQLDPDNPLCKEDSAYPAAPDSEYGWEKLFSERLYLAFKRNYDVDVKIARYHNIFGPEGTYDGGREKAPAALCRKVILAENNSSIDIWGDGTQTRSFLYIDECVEGTILLTNSNLVGPYNIGSEEMVSINQLAEMIIEISGKKLSINHIDGPLGVKGRNSDNDLIFEDLKWRPSDKLVNGLIKTYEWIEKQY
tara:strand:+ start:380 stop:1333 length:954 start_codon:yes stop_codon:yes gene_type:complete